MHKLLKTMIVSAILAATLMSLSSSVMAGESAKNLAFDRIKQLAGEWKGITVSPKTGKAEEVSVRYEVTSGGTTVTEWAFTGTPYEMLTVYYPEANGVGATHFSMLGNRPSLSLRKADDQSMVFDMVDNNGILSPIEPHMHELTLKFEGEDKLRQDWAYYKNNQPSASMTILLTRK